MQQGLSGCDAATRLVLEHLAEEVQARVVNVLLLDEVSQIHAGVLLPLDRLKDLVLGNAFPVHFVWRAHDPENLTDLQLLVRARKQGPTHRQLREDAPDRPDVHRRSILIHLEEELG